MKIKIKRVLDETDLERQEMTITEADGKKCKVLIGPLSESPEDAIIGRGLIACTEIAEYMEMAYEVGKSGEPFTVDIEGPEEEEE